MTLPWITHCQTNVSWRSLTLLKQCMLGAIVYAPPPLNDIWLDEGECHVKKLELAKERAQACDRWRFEAKPPPVSVPTSSPNPVSTASPCHSDGPVVYNDNSSESSNSFDEDSLVSAAANDPFIAEVQLIANVQGEMRELYLEVNAKAKG
jgi:hypothetical protein